MVEGTTTRSPARRLRTSLPTSSITPTASCPRIVPGFMPESVPRMKCRSVPQMALAVMRISASVGSFSFGSRTVSRRISPMPWKTTAFMGLLLGPDQIQRLASRVPRVLTACQQDVHRLSTGNLLLAPGVRRDLAHFLLGDDVDEAQEDVARQLLQPGPAREIGLRCAEVQAQLLIAAKNLGGAAQRTVMNIVKH